MPEMMESFSAGGFVPPRTEFLHVDNSAGNALDGYAGLRDLIGRSTGRVVVAVHQDVRLLADGADRLREVVADLDERCPLWAVAGNAGMRANGRPVTRITDPHETDARRGGPFPAVVVSLDENFLLLRREVGVLPSADLRGFHFYGLDLCLQARLAGRTAHVVDFHLRHLGRGHVDAAFFTCRDAIEAKYAGLLPPTILRTTCSPVLIGPAALRPALGLARRPLAALFRRRDRWFAARTTDGPCPDRTGTGLAGFQDRSGDAASVGWTIVLGGCGTGEVQTGGGKNSM